jgi:uncharacterized membrane protein
MPRVANEYDIFVRADQAPVRSKSRDVSPLGMGIYSDQSVSVGAAVDLTIFIMEANLNYEVKGVVRHCTPLTGANASKGKFLIGVEFTEGQEKTLPFVEQTDKQSSHTITQTTILDTDVATVYRLLTRIDRFPEWVPDVKTAKVLDRYPDGKCKRVEFEHMFLVLKIRYIDEYEYDDQNYMLRWKNAGGDKAIVNNTGEYRLKRLAADKTAVTFHANITLSFIPSNRLLNYFVTVGVRKALKSLKSFVERHAKSN